MATRAKYTRVKQQDQKEEKPDTDIIMRFNPTYGRYVTRALTLFFGEGKSFVTVKAADRLIDRALWVAEVVKRRVAGLHQITNITEREVVDVYEPRQQGLLRVQTKRFLTIIEVTLTKEPTAEQKKSPGYQAPLQLKNEQYLTKQAWQKQQADRKQRFSNREQNRDNREEGRRGPRGDRGGRGDREDRRDRGDDRRDNRGEQRRRGGGRR